MTLGFAEFGTSTQNKQFLNNFARFLSGHFQIWEIVNRNRRFAFCWNVIQFYISLFWLHFGSFRECSERGTKFYFPANSSKASYIIDRFAVRPNGDHVGKQQNNLNGWPADHVAKNDQNHGHHFWFTSLWPGGHVGGQSPKIFFL